MVPIEYRTINRAICLVEDQDVREAARAALHALFRQQCRFEKLLREKGVVTR